MPNALCQNNVTDLIEAAGIAMLDDLQGDALLKRQFDLEDGMKAEGAMRYAKAVESAQKTKTEGDMVPQKDLIRENVLLVAAGLNEWLEAEQARIDAMTGRGRRQYKLPFNWLKELSAPTCAFIGLKTVFNQTGRTRGTAVLAQLIGRAIEEEITVARFVEKMPKLYGKIVDDFTSRSTVHHRRVLRAAIQRHAPELLDFDGGKASQNVQVATGLVVLASIIEKTGLIENELATSKTGTVENIKLTQKTLDYINQRNEIAQFFMPFYKPCVIPPREWTDVRSGGYHGVLAGRHCVVKGRHGDREYIRALRKADMSLVYEGLNYLQNTAWKVNAQVFEVMDQLAYESTQGDLPDVKKVDPLERLPFFDNDAKGWEEWQKKAFKDWKVKNAEIHTDNYEKEGAVTNLTATLETARQYLNEDRFYFPWNLDTRGRAYPIARGLQPQGSDWQKALLQFAEGQPYDAWARYYLMFHGANCYGETEDGVKLDKELYQTRVEWIEENRDFIFSIADDPMGMAHAWDKVESPWMFLAFCFEFTRCERQMMAGLPAVTHLAPAFDGSCNGLQHFSAALRDEIGGAAVNLTANETPSDIYRLVATKLQAYLMEVAKGVAVGVIEEEVEDDDGKRIKYKLCDVTMARRWLATSKIGRDLCKQPVMTTPYGSNQQGIKMQMVKKLDKQGFKFPALPWNDQDKPSDNFVECTWLAGKIVTAIGEVVVKAREAMDWLQDAARVANKNGSEIWWTAPSGLPIKQFYEDLGQIRINTEFMGQTYKPKMIDLAGTPKLSKHEQVNGIAPNFVHSLDASAMLLTVVRLGRKGIKDFFMIHDSFGVPACFGNVLWQETRNVFVEIYEKHDVLQEFRDGLIETLPEELAEKIKPLPRKGKLDLNEVRRSDFFFA